MDIHKFENSLRIKVRLYTVILLLIWLVLFKLSKLRLGLAWFSQVRLRDVLTIVKLV